MAILYNTAMAKPFFSIIVPTLNEAKYLPHLLEDLSKQTFQDFEVIIVDGQSDDQTVTKAKSFIKILSSLKILTSPKRHVCVQRNLGANVAQANVLIFSDADNRLPPFFLQGVKYRLDSSNSNILSFWLKPDISTPQNDTIALAINTFLELQSIKNPKYLFEALIVIEKECFNSVGGFTESIDYAEGKNVIRSATAKGYNYTVFRDPNYTTSFRRFRKFGLLSMAGNVARLELSELLGPGFHSNQARKLYPMIGGTLFTKPKKIKNKFLKNIQKILKDF